MRRRLILFLAAFAWLAPVPAGAASRVPVQVTEARIRWLPGDLPMAGYFVIRNTGERPLRLIGASSPAYRRIVLHRTVSYGRMKPAKSFEIAPGWSVQFTPGGNHLMLMGRTRAMHPGDLVPITLHFAGGGALRVRFRVRGADLR